MNRPIQDTLPEGATAADWRLMLFLEELSWGVFLIDAEGNETLFAAVLDQISGVAVGELLERNTHASAIQIRVRRLR